MRKLLIRIAAGAVGGAVATLFMTRSARLAGRLPERAKPPMPSRDPGDFMVELGEQFVGPPLQKMHSRDAHGLRWAYGISWPLGLAKNASGLASHVAYGALASAPLAIAAPLIEA